MHLGCRLLRDAKPQVTNSRDRAPIREAAVDDTAPMTSATPLTGRGRTLRTAVEFSDGTTTEEMPMSMYPHHHIERIAFDHHADLVEDGRRHGQAPTGDPNPTTPRASTRRRRSTRWIAAAGAGLAALLTVGAYAAADEGEAPTTPTPVVYGGLGGGTLKAR